MIIQPPKTCTHNSRYKDHVNEYINMNNVISFCFDRENYYPDNEGIPVIRFTCKDNLKLKWFFDKGEEALVLQTIGKLIQIGNKNE